MNGMLWLAAALWVALGYFAGLVMGFWWGKTRERAIWHKIMDDLYGPRWQPISQPEGDAYSDIMGSIMRNRLELDGTEGK